MMRGKKELLVSGWFSREPVLCPVSVLLPCLLHFNFTTTSLPPDLGQKYLKILFMLCFLIRPGNRWVAISLNKISENNY